MKRAALFVLLAGCQQILGLDSPELVDASSGDPQWRQISPGGFHTCAIKADDAMWCWGGNYNSQAAEQEGYETAPHPVGTDSWREVAAGYLHSCAIRTDDTLWCWGFNGYGALGDGTTATSYLPRQISGSWQHVSTTYYHSCAVKTDGSLWCWGRNLAGSLGLGNLADASTLSPMKVDGTWKRVSTGFSHTCAIATDDRMWCWGSNSVRQLGLDDLSPRSRPVMVSEQPVTSVATGTYATCALLASGQIYCAGENVFGALGRGVTSASETFAPVLVDGTAESDWTSVSMRVSTACGIRAGTTYCWGTNNFGQQATFDKVIAPSPRAISSQTWSRFEAGFFHACGIDSKGDAYCVGNASNGQLGTAATSHRAPSLVGDDFAELVVGTTSTCGRRTGGDLACAGYGPTGIGDDFAYQSLVPISGRWTSIGMGDLHKCGNEQDGLSCWGHNGFGQLGDGTLVQSQTPKMILGPQVMVDGWHHTCAIDTANALRCWGYNEFGEVGGPAPPANVLTPFLVPGPAWSSVSTGGFHTVGIESGLLKTWGRGLEGQLGDNMAARSAPISIGSGYVRAWAGAYHTCAINSNGQALCWGSNASGQLGTGDTTSRATPTPIMLSGMTKLTELSLGSDHTCAVSETNDLYCWGSNVRGQLGNGSNADSSVPVALGRGWAHVSAGGLHTCATKTDGSGWCWGNNDNGQLADGTAWRATLEKVP
jgi:alpha-tubulin suppressor-like RCC1 family protein